MAIAKRLHNTMTTATLGLHANVLGTVASKTEVSIAISPRVQKLVVVLM